MIQPSSILASALTSFPQPSQCKVTLPQAIRVTAITDVNRNAIIFFINISPSGLSAKIIYHSGKKVNRQPCLACIMTRPPCLAGCFSSYLWSGDFWGKTGRPYRNFLRAQKIPKLTICNRSRTTAGMLPLTQQVEYCNVKIRFKRRS